MFADGLENGDSDMDLNGNGGFDATDKATFKYFMAGGIFVDYSAFTL
jgi:hypothetical protein